MAKRATKDGANFATIDALFEDRFDRDVQDLVDAGEDRATAEQQTRDHSEAGDVVVQNPDGTFRFFEPKGEFLTASPEALRRSKAANRADKTATEGISAETSGTDIDQTQGEVVAFPADPEPRIGGLTGPRTFESLVEAFERSGDLHLRFPREYSSWRHAKARVNNPNDKKFASHGRRGIGMSKSWQDSFAAFLKDMGRRPKGTTLERNRNNGDYAKSNCRWATVSDQNANRRGWAKQR